MKFLSFFILPTSVFLVFSSCATVNEPPKSKWTVKVSTEGVMKTWVAKLDGSKQCEKTPGSLSPQSALDELRNQGVLTFQSRFSQAKRKFITQCGAPTGRSVEVEIAITDLPKAESLGYQESPTQN